jgi:DNA polymerase III sliding clamp (beta) subunit (PCNA family)
LEQSTQRGTNALKLELRGSVFRVVGTDGHRLSVAEGTARTEGSSTFSALLLHSAATLMVKKVVRRAEVKGHRHAFRRALD